MNGREFCREPGYRSALILTWAFDGVFFERVVLPELRSGGTGTVVVLADRGEVEAGIARWSGMAQHLGRRYALETADVPGHFHPKLILKTGPAGALVWLGTGNITPGGWGANRELATTWRVGPGEADEGSWIAPFLDQLLRWSSSASAREAVARVRDEPWIAASSPQHHAFIWSSAEETLAAQLGRRWAGRRFSHVRVITGSTDKSGAFLQWAHRTFGVESAEIVVHAECATFDAEALETLPMRVQFIEPLGRKPMHAKCYWFEGPGGVAALVGSANCSGSAWVRPPALGGNVEAIVAFDAPERGTWADVLAVFDAPRVSIREHLREREDPATGDVVAAPRYRMLSAQLDVESATVEVELAPYPPEGARLTLLVGREELPLLPRVTLSGTAWTAARPEESSTARVLFARVKVTDGNAVAITAVRWIDQLHELDESARDRRVSAALGRLAVPLDTREQRRVVEDLRLAMDVVLTDHSSFPDVAGRRARPSATAGEGDATARLDPRRMAVALREISSSGREAIEQSHPADMPASLTGVLRVLFAPEHEEATAEGNLPDLGSEEDDLSPAPGPVGRPSGAVPADRMRKRLAAQMDRFLVRLRERSFADTCTATQLIQAVALPIAVATLGGGSGWVDPGPAQAWTTSAVSALLHEKIMDGAAYEGLLEHVGRRYKAENRQETFEAVVGDGLLWAATAAALVGLNWAGLSGRIRRALLLRDLFQRRELSARAKPEELHAIAARFRHGDAVAAITSELPHAEAALEKMEHWLATDFESLLRSQAAAGKSHAVGDPLWRPGVGWVFVVEAAPIATASKVAVEPWRPGQFSAQTGMPRVLGAGFYVNVRHGHEAATQPVPEAP